MADLGEALSERELDVLQRLARGASNKEIASDLSISPYTVKTHLRNIFAKLGVSTRTEAIHVGMQQGLLAAPAGAAAPASNGSAPAAEIAPSEDEALPADEVSLPAVEHSHPPASRRWLFAVLLGGIILLTAALLYVLQIPGGLLNSQPEPADLYPEQAIGDTRWLSSRPLPEARASRAAAALGLDIYLIGGETAGGVTGDVSVFDTRERTWREAAGKPTPVAGATAAELFGEIYVAGGQLENGEPTDVVEAYSPTQNAWRRVAALPRPLAGAVTVADGGYLYVVGGSDASGPLDTAYVYDPAGDSWRPIAALPAPRMDAAGAALTGNLYLVGGDDGFGAQRSCFAYNPAADEWSACPDLLEPRSGAGATVLLNKLYVIGGGTGSEEGASYGEVYDPNSRTWQVLNLPPDMGAWSEPGVAQVENRIFAQGGLRGGAVSDANLVYAPVVYQTYIPAASSGEEETP